MTTDRDTIARQAREIVALQKRLHDAESREPKVRERTRVKIEYRESPRTAELERENAKLKEQVKNLKHRLGGAK